MAKIHVVQPENIKSKSIKKTIRKTELLIELVQLVLQGIIIYLLLR